MNFPISGNFSLWRKMPPQLPKVMKLTAIFLLAFFLQLSAKSVSQVTLSLKNAPAEKVFREIERQTGIGFLYTKRMVSNLPRVTIEVKNAPVNEVLDKCFQGQPLEYSFDKNTIVITQKKSVIPANMVANSLIVTPPPPPVEVTGKVTDESGNPLAGVSIIIKGSTIGTASNEDGSFSLNVSSLNETLIFSITGFREVSIGIAGRRVINVVLESLSTKLEDVIITGYGREITRGELTTAITRLSSDEFEKIPSQNIGEVLKGSVAGVQINNTSGAPGAGFDIKIRGIGSINADNSPLYIVDGVKLSTGNTFIKNNQYRPNSDISALNAVNPEDIESIEVLKGGAAAAIYGAQASNGVILITTKRGRSGKTVVTAKVEGGVSTNAHNIDFMNGGQWMDYYMESLANTYGDGSHSSGEDLFRNQYDYFAKYGYADDVPIDDVQDVNLLDYIFHKGASQKYNLSANGGSDNTKFFVSGGYEDTKGTILNSSYKAYRLRTNFNQKLNSKLNLSLNLGLNYENINSDCEDGNWTDCPVSAALFGSPIAPLYNADGTYNTNVNFGISSNMAVIKNEKTTLNSVFSTVGNFEINYKFSDWLTLRGLTGIDYRNVENRFSASEFYQPSIKGSVSEGITSSSNLNSQLTANYKFSIGENNFSGVFGVEYLREFLRYSYSEGQNIVPGFEVLDATANPVSAEGHTSEYRMASYFGTIGYNYKQRYLLQLTGRYDGNSKFGAVNRWGFFPSVSAAWRISNEDFFNNNLINDLKLRMGLSVTGNSEIDYFAARSLFGIQGSYDGTRALKPLQLGNRELTWEEARSINLGLDFSLLNDRLGGSIDIYTTDNQKLLLNRPIPKDNGYSSITSNVGIVRNQGIEIALNSTNVAIEGFTWKSRFNISFNRNKVVQLNEGQTQLASQYSEFVGPIMVGRPLGIFYVPEYAGVNPADGRPMWYDKSGELTYQPGTDDRILIDGTPKAVGGFGNTFSFGNGFTVDAFFQYSLGGRAFSQVLYYFARTPTYGNNLFEFVYTDHWKSPGDITYLPKAWWTTTYPGTADWRTQPGSNMVWDNSYVRLKTVSFAYDFSPKIIKSLKISSLQLYVSGINLITWTKWPGWDPEVAFQNSYYVIRGSYPSRRQINFGLKANL